MYSLLKDIKIMQFIIEFNGIIPSHLFQPQYTKSTSASNSRSSSINRKVRLTKTRGRPRPRSLIDPSTELNLRSISPSKIPITNRVSLPKTVVSLPQSRDTSPKSSKIPFTRSKSSMPQMDVPHEPNCNCYLEPYDNMPKMLLNRRGQSLKCKGFKNLKSQVSGRMMRSY